MSLHKLFPLQNIFLYLTLCNTSDLTSTSHQSNMIVLKEKKQAILIFSQKLCLLGLQTFYSVVFFSASQITAPPSVRGRLCACAVPPVCFLLHSPPLLQPASSHSARSAPPIKVRNKNLFFQNMFLRNIFRRC